MSAATNGFLITPNGFLIADLDPITQRDEWLAVRRLGIGSSDIPAIVGSSDYRTKLEVYYDKRAEIGDQGAGEAALWGNLLEDVVAQEWARRNGHHVERIGMVAHIDHPWRLASLDRLVRNCPTRKPCALEVKTRSAWTAGSWRDDVPDDVLAQTLWQLHVTGLDHIHVACLIGGQRLTSFIVDPDPQVTDYIVTEAQQLWDCVQAGVPPHIDPSALLLDLLNRLHPDRVGAVEVDYTQVARIHADYDQAAADAKAAKARQDAAKAELVQLLGAGDTAVVTRDGLEVPLATYRPDQRTHVDTDQLKADHPNAYAACVTKRPTTPILRFKTKEF